MFSLVIADEQFVSKVYFGGYDDQIIKLAKTKINKKDQTQAKIAGIKDQTEDGIFWMNIQSNDHWAVKVYDASIGNVPLKFSANEMLFDSGASLNYIPLYTYL